MTVALIMTIAWIIYVNVAICILYFLWSNKEIVKMAEKSLREQPIISWNLALRISYFCHAIALAIISLAWPIVFFVILITIFFRNGHNKELQ